MAEKAGNAGQSRGGRHKREPRTGVPRRARSSAKSPAHRREIRLAKPRVANALAAAKAERERIAALVAATAVPELEAEVVVIRQVISQGRHLEVEVERPRPVVDLASMAEGELGWSLGQARLLYQDGYSLAHVVARTGWGAGWFRDLMGPDGYYADLPIVWDAA